MLSRFKLLNVVFMLFHVLIIYVMSRCILFFVFLFIVFLLIMLFSCFYLYLSYFYYRILFPCCIYHVSFIVLSYFYHYVVYRRVLFLFLLLLLLFLLFFLSMFFIFQAHFVFGLIFGPGWPRTRPRGTATARAHHSLPQTWFGLLVARPNGLVFFLSSRCHSFFLSSRACPLSLHAASPHGPQAGFFRSLAFSISWLARPSLAHHLLHGLLLRSSTGHFFLLSLLFASCPRGAHAKLAFPFGFPSSMACWPWSLYTPTPSFLADPMSLMSNFHLLKPQHVKAGQNAKLKPFTR